MAEQHDVRDWDGALGRTNVPCPTCGGQGTISEDADAKAVVRDVLQDVAGRCQSRMRDDRTLTYGDLAEICREIAEEHGTGVYV